MGRLRISISIILALIAAVLSSCEAPQQALKDDYSISVSIEEPWKGAKEIQPESVNSSIPGINAMKLSIHDPITGLTASWNVTLGSGMQSLYSFTLNGWAPGKYEITASGYWNDTQGGAFPASDDGTSHLILQNTLITELGHDNLTAFVTLRTPVSPTSEDAVIRLYPSSDDSSMAETADFTVSGMIEYLSGSASSLNIDGHYVLGSRQADEKGEYYYPMTLSDLPTGSAIITVSLSFPSGAVRSDADAMKLMPGLSSAGILDFRTAYEGEIPEYDPMRYWSRFTFADSADLPIIEFDGTRFLMPNSGGIRFTEDASTYRTLGYAIGGTENNAIASSGAEYILAASNMVTKAVINDTGATWNTMTLPSGWSGAVSAAYGDGRFAIVNGGTLIAYNTGA